MLILQSVFMKSFLSYDFRKSIGQMYGAETHPFQTVLCDTTRTADMWPCSAH